MRTGGTTFDLLGSPAALAIILPLAWLLPAGPFTAFAVVLLFIYAWMSPPVAVSASFRLALPFLLMAGWATLMGIGHDRYDLLKDLWYALKLCMCIMIGFLIGVRTLDVRGPLTAFGCFAVASALWSILTWRLSGGASIDTVGLEGFAHLSLAAVVALPLLALDTIKQRGSRQLVSGVLTCILGFAILISASRTTIISAAAMAMAAVGLFSSWRRIVIAFALAAGAMYLLYLLLPSYNGGDLTLAVKFRRSLDEIFLTDSIDPQQMILNWRGFEAYNAQLLFDQSSLFRKIFGNGFGTSVDLGIQIYGEDGTITRFQPILHNGYYYILIKYGIAGLICYMGTLLWYAFVGRRSQDASAPEDRLLRGIIATILFATLVITGLYNKSALQDLTILLGWFIGQGCRFRFERILGRRGTTTPAFSLPARRAPQPAMSGG